MNNESEFKPNVVYYYSIVMDVLVALVLVIASMVVFSTKSINATGAYVLAFSMLSSIVKIFISKRGYKLIFPVIVGAILIASSQNYWFMFPIGGLLWSLAFVMHAMNK